MGLLCYCRSEIGCGHVTWIERVSGEAQWGPMWTLWWTVEFRRNWFSHPAHSNSSLFRKATMEFVISCRFWI